MAGKPVRKTSLKTAFPQAVKSQREMAQIPEVKGQVSGLFKVKRSLTN